MSRPDFWSDQNKARELSQKASALRADVEEWQALSRGARDLAALADSEDTEELEALFSDLLQKYDSLNRRLLFSGEYDERNAIVSVHAGAGGTEAQDWAEMLLRMFLRFAESKGFRTELLHESRGSEAGLKSATMRVSGRFAYGNFRSEHGVHRLVRISPFDAEKMRHTSFALVEILPELEDVPETEIDTKDLRIDTFLAGGHGGQSVQKTESAVRVTHLPTGISVNCQNERSQQQNKETALKILRAKLYQKKLEEQEEEKRRLRGEPVSAEWGSQIRSYVLHPYKLVKDHRTDYEEQDAEAVLDGKLDGFVEKYLEWRAGKK